MTLNDTTDDTFLDEEIEEYLGIALYAQSGGFSKGTANVSAHDVTKLKGLLKFYAKKPHPFTACVRDNRKRFGDATEKYCAVLKDLIVGNTKWRKGHKSSKGAHLSESTLAEIFHLDLEDLDDFWSFIASADLPQGDENVNLAQGDIAWNQSTSWNAIKAQIQQQLNADEGSGDSSDGDYAMPMGGMMYWVNDVSGDAALVCCGADHYVVPFAVDKKGTVTVSDESDWTKVEQEWVETSVTLSDPIGAELFFDAADGNIEIGEDGLIWKTILREGTWKMSPRNGRPVAKPLTVVKEGVSDGDKLVVSMSELKDNFEAGVVEHVTIPTSHADKVTENTGFVKGLRWGTDDKGRTILQAAHDFREPDIKDKVLKGTIANTSAGILFDYVNKETGKKNSAVLGHVALTNHPWLNEMSPFGVMASENLNVLNFSEDIESEVTPGGENMEDAQVEATTPKFLSDLGLSEDEAAARLARYEELERRDAEHQVEARQRAIDAKITGWEDARKSPALVAVASALLSAVDSSETVLSLSEDNKTVELSAEDIIDRLMDAAPALTLSTDPVVDADVLDTKPEADAEGENADALLAADIKRTATDLFLSGMSEADALAEAKRRHAKSE